MGKTRSWWGWGWAEDAIPYHECIALGAQVPGTCAEPLSIPRIADLSLPRPRVTLPGSLDGVVSTAPGDRAAHTFGKGYRDVVRALRKEFETAPDAVAFPRSESDVVDLLDWVAENNVAMIPYGGGSSVVGGVEYRGGDHAGVLSLDLSLMDRVLEVDSVSRAAHIQAGALGPVLEDQLRPHGYTLRHFPQSFEFSTLGGWLATRSGGHYATLHTRIDDFVESMRVVTPAGINESWRLPGSGAGPSPDRMFLGSEGILGVITEAWMRVQDRPRHKASTAVVFREFAAALDAVRAIAQSGLYPSNCRLLDPGEVTLSGAAQSGQSMLVLGFESANVPVEDQLRQAVTIAQEHGGTPKEGGHEHGDAVGSWRSTFLRMPYVRDALVRMSAIIETFETACTWNRAHGLIEAVRSEVGAAAMDITGNDALINCRFTHVYPDGPAPYFTVIAAGRRGAEVAMWDEIKAAVTEIFVRHHATITHHHAVGRDHRPGYDRQRPEPFATALRAAKQALDQHGILNPGVLLS